MVLKLKEREPVEEIPGVRPTSDKYMTQNVRHVGMVLRDFNSQVLPNFPMTPKQLEEGLSLFVDWKNKKSEFSLLGTKYDGRSGSFPICFSDVYGNRYERVILKGFGIPEFAYENIHGDTIAKPARGLADYSAMKKDLEMANLFLEHRIRTAVPIAIGELKTVILKDGTEMKVEDLRGRVIPKDFVPVLYFRGLRDGMRLKDADADDLKHFAAKNNIDFPEYPSWWAGMQGDNLAGMHNLQKIHRFLHERHNVTTAAEIVDLDSVVGIQNAAGKGSFLKDATDMMDAVLSVENKCDEAPFLKAPSTFMKRYVGGFTKISEEDFSALCSSYRAFTNRQTREEIAKLFEKRFEKKLE
jgi:hypothetical protein